MSPAEFTVIGFVALQFATVVWFASSLNTKVGHMMASLDKIILEFEAHKKEDEEKLHRHDMDIQALRLAHIRDRGDTE